jgi:hypothetical protein
VNWLAGRFLVAAAVCAAATAAWGHDSWLSPSRHDSPPGQLVLELSTGNRYPVQEFGSTAASVVRAGCAAPGGGALALRPLREHPQWLDLAAATGRRDQTSSCWLELASAEIELEPRLVDVYFAEIRAGAAQRQAWAALLARGVAWRESYRKFARIELASPSASARDLAAARRPVGMDLEIVVLGDQPIAAGRALAFQVLRDGQPLADFPVELVSERSALGVWRQTDSQGLLRHTLPFGGSWLLRGTDLRLAAGKDGAWESRFVTLVLETR